MKIEKAFALVLREHRLRAGLSQHALAYEANINRNNISLYETGERLPGLATLFLICRVLGVPPEQFVAEVRALNPEV